MASPAFGQLLQTFADRLEDSQAKTKYIRANQGLILSTGGFIFNRDMVSHYAPKYNTALQLGSLSCDGSGIILGQSAGGAIHNMHHVSTWRFINPPLSWACGIIVNKQGQRFVNEQCYGSKIGYHMIEENNDQSWLIVNQTLYSKAIKECLFNGYWVFQSIPALFKLLFGATKASSPALLAQKLDMPAQALQDSIEQYNKACRGERSDAFGKAKDFQFEMNQGPYYAMDISSQSSLMPLPSIT